ncbi:OmpA family protein [Wenzhouxiangella limi]|uniref:OmpA family protein n=1 Tax=Wenzhouxiangella limi TaxID=2707351 RepID=A0A845UVG5_9GAMM|nr:OmpA family protein [Wenzhouxiangella limi]NDY95477.1 OmpA family protein [Wenzhouxiangella limi]
MIPRRKKSAGGAPLWMVTFADMMTLLVTFFVLLFSFVIIDVQRYKTQAEYIRAGFTASVFEQMTGRVRDLNVADQQGSIVPDFPTVPSAPDQQEQKRIQPLDTAELAETSQPSTAEQVEANIIEELGGLIDMGDVTVERMEDEVIIRLQDRFAFEVGSEIIQPQFRAMLMEIQSLLRDIRGEFVVSGHTDNLPIRTQRFRSNWELSSARAASVVHELTEDGSIPPERFRVEGYADTLPIADNATEEGRARNRRVEILIRPRTLMEPPAEDSIIELDQLSELPREPE